MVGQVLNFAYVKGDGRVPNIPQTFAISDQWRVVPVDFELAPCTNEEYKELKNDLKEVRAYLTKILKERETARQELKTKDPARVWAFNRGVKLGRSEIIRVRAEGCTDCIFKGECLEHFPRPVNCPSYQPSAPV